MRTFLMLACIVISVASVGCCGPLGCGPGCDVPVGCNECDNFGSGRAYFGSRIYNGGCGVAGCRCGIGPVCGSRGVRRACGGPGIARASIDRVRQRQPIQQLKRTLVCGSGCGETYLGEWISSPPDSCDPCRGDQFVGGATKCRPFCWQRGTLLRGLCGGLYGGRYYGGVRAAATCGCGVPSCGGCGDEIIGESYFSDEYIETPHYIESPHYSGGAAGCSTCDADHEVGGTRIARSHSQPRPTRARSKSHPKTAIDARHDQRLYR